MTAIPADLMAFLNGFRPPHPDLTPGQIRVHPGLYNRIISDPTLTGLGIRDTGPPPRPARLLGFELIVGNDLPAGVWRVCTRNGTLLRDSRSPNPIGGRP